MKLLKKYYIVFFIFLILLFVGLFAGYKLFIAKPTYIYVKIKVGQGFWWANTKDPSMWYINAINRGDISYDTLGNPEVEIINKRTYFWLGNYQNVQDDQYDTFLIVKMRVSENKRTGLYNFNRSVISVGTPIELQFPKANITGTVIAVSKNFPKENLIEKTVYLEKRDAYPWEYDAIKIHDSVSDGKNTIFKILDKSMTETPNLLSDPNKGYITIKARMKMKKVNNIYVLGEEKIIEPGRTFNLSLSTFVLDGFTISKIE